MTQRKYETFPPTEATDVAVFKYVFEHGGEIKMDGQSGGKHPIFWELADRLGISSDDRSVPHLGNGTMWANRVHFGALHNRLLGLFLPVRESGFGVWKTAPGVTMEVVQDRVRSFHKKMASTETRRQVRTQGKITPSALRKAAAKAVLQEEVVPALHEHVLNISLSNLISITADGDRLMIRYKTS
jgi:hypothetical protein